MRCGSGGRLALSYLLEPLAHCGPRGDTLQLAKQKLLHGLVIARGAGSQLVAYRFRDVSNCNLYHHAGIVPAMALFRKPARRLGHIVFSGTRLAARAILYSGLSCPRQVQRRRPIQQLRVEQVRRPSVGGS